MPGSTNPTRGSIDLDDYSGGFGTWSGTSFAAPALAGDIAARMMAASRESDADDDPEPDHGIDPDGGNDACEGERDDPDPRVRRAASAVTAVLKGAPDADWR
jgi:hypothetical protein